MWSSYTDTLTITKTLLNICFILYTIHHTATGLITLKIDNVLCNTLEYIIVLLHFLNFSRYGFLISQLILHFLLDLSDLTIVWKLCWGDFSIYNWIFGLHKAHFGVIINHCSSSALFQFIFGLDKLKLELILHYYMH